jgi:23S rRNA pseudouridine2605 synthase
MEERLQKLIAAAGIASRRHAEELIAAGEVTVNGQVITEPGTKADAHQDHIKVRGKLINPLLAKRENVYLLLNKPKGYLSSVSLPDRRPMLKEILPPSLGRIYPVCSLDFNTDGLLLFNNAGEFTNFITSARNRVEKVYEVKVKGLPPEPALERIRRGVVLDDGTKTAPAKITKVAETKTNAWFEVVLHQGRNQQIRRMFDLIGHSVVKLRRARIGFLQDDSLRPGEWRRLTPYEVRRLMKDRRKEKPDQAARGRSASRGSGAR